MKASSEKKANSLINESSPYLLQHAYNPVDWVAFSPEAFEKAKKEDKPVLISIGYSACHWCHVMEHESFEDNQVAALMNEHFVCIKVDREERSDVDNLYMQAVQMMTGHGGWPLNCFVLPDGKPFYGGTYFQKAQWLNILQSLTNLCQNDKAKVQTYADELTQGLQQSEELLTIKKQKLPLEKQNLKDSVFNWKKRMDNVEGGPDKAPKFPLPSNYLFLLRYAYLENDLELKKHVDLTLKKMAFGGIFDQLHGGFCRYSTDKVWKVPHFEKMLYDNAQLASLYTEAFTYSSNPLYKQIAIDTLSFVEKEWFNAGGYFYSAFDADSDGEEGKYYVWRQEDLKSLLEADYDLFSRYFLINEKGYWEDGNYILMRNEDTAQLLVESGLSAEDLEKKINACKEILKQEVKSRIMPGLDDKTITSWNALMCTAFAKAYLAFGDEKHKEIALKSVQFLKTTMWKNKSDLLRTFKNGTAKIDGFLEDYAFMIESLINCYLISKDETHLQDAKTMMLQALERFNNPQAELLFYTSADASQLVTRTTEISDNVVPASNSQMAHNLFVLAKYFAEPAWEERAGRMLTYVVEEMTAYGTGYSNWANLALNFLDPPKEVAIVGKNVDEIFAGIRQHGHTNAIFAVSAVDSALPLLKDRYVPGETLIYVCENNTCQLPVSTVEKALEQFA